MISAPKPRTGCSPAKPSYQVWLDLEGMEVEARHNLSAAARVQNVLFLAGDEGCQVHRLERQTDGCWGRHMPLPLQGLITLADPEAEIDIEGLAVEDDWLWILGSRACTRAKLTKK